MVTGTENMGSKGDFLGEKGVQVDHKLPTLGPI